MKEMGPGDENSLLNFTLNEQALTLHTKIFGIYKRF
jgi:hypothetical protein